MKITRAAWCESDDAIYSFLHEGLSSGCRGVLVTIVNVEGGNPRPIGAHMAVLHDGRYVGYVSGGCVEPAVAAEALQLLSGQSTERLVRFGSGSRYMDIRLPCGGAVDLFFSVDPDCDIIGKIAALLGRRQRCAINIDPVTILPAQKVFTGWRDSNFIRDYTPPTHLMLAGNGNEMVNIAGTALANGFTCSAIVPGDELADKLAAFGVSIVSDPSLGSDIAMFADEWTAIIMLFHDFDWEMKLLPVALETKAFFIGALGSPKTHRSRLAGLRKLGIAERSLARIRGPIGMIPATRSSSALAISILAEVTASRMELEKSR